MAGRLTDWQIERWLEDVVNNTWVALHFDNPDIAGQYNSEFYGGGYRRVQAVMYQPNNRAVWNSAPVIFNSLPGIMITHVCGWDASINGNMRFSIELPSPVRVISGSQYSFGPGSLAVSMD